MKKFATIASLLVVLCAATVIPSATAKEQIPVPPACAGLVTQLSDTLKKVVGLLTAVPPNPTGTAPLLGDVLGLLNALQGAKCLPAAPVSAPGVEVPMQQAEAPEQCLSATLGVFASVFAVLSQVVPGAGVPDVPKLLKDLAALLKNLGDALKHCGLPEPPGGLPTVPSLPI